MELNPTRQPLVSIVLATNRGGPFLEETIRSVINQTWPSWELILVDDRVPTTSITDSIANQYEEVLVVHGPRRGVSAARNVGLSHSQGDLITFLDDDDVWMPERLNHQVAALEAAPSAVASYCQWHIIGVHNETLMEGELVAGDVHAFLRGNAQVPIPTLLVRRDALDSAGWFHPLLPPAEDLDLIYRLARMGSLCFVPEVLVHYRRHAANVTNDLRASLIASQHALTIQLWDAERKQELDIVGDVHIGLKRSKRYWLELMCQAAWGRLRKGQIRAAYGDIRFCLRQGPLTTLRIFLYFALSRRHTPTT